MVVTSYLVMLYRVIFAVFILYANLKYETRLMELNVRARNKKELLAQMTYSHE